MPKLPEKQKQATTTKTCFLREQGEGARKEIAKVRLSWYWVTETGRSLSSDEDEHSRGHVIEIHKCMGMSNILSMHSATGPDLRSLTALCFSSVKHHPKGKLACLS